MSIFPRRTVPGKPVTIHWHLGATPLTAGHACSSARLVVRDPLGHVTVLFEGHVLVLPDPSEERTGPREPGTDYASKEVPLLVLAEHFTGSAPTAALLETLERMRTGRHRYFVFRVPADAPLGKYSLAADICTDGTIRHFTTVKNDHFFVESLIVKEVVRVEGGLQVKVRNPSPEVVPARVVECHGEGSTTRTESRAIGFSPLEDTRLDVASDKAFLAFSEDREVLPLTADNSPLVVRNQRILSLPDSSQPSATTYAVPLEGDEAYALTGPRKAAWDAASRLVTKIELQRQVGVDVVEEMMANGLIEELRVAAPSRCGPLTTHGLDRPSMESSSPSIGPTGKS